MNLIIGASSGLGKCLAEDFSNNNNSFSLLVARSKILTKSRNVKSISHNILNNSNKKLLKHINKNSLENIFFTVGKADWKSDNVYIKDKIAKSILDTNFYAISRLTYDLIKNNKLKKNCLICFCSSVTTILPRHRQMIYCASKSALNSFVRSLKFYIQIKNLNYRVANLQLGYLQTKMNRMVDTPFKKIDPKKLSKLILKNYKKLDGTLYFPRYWLLIKIILSLMPEKIIIMIFKIFFSSKKYF